MALIGETEPLLAREDGRRRAKKKPIVRVTPLPKQQMVVLCFLTFSEPMSEFIIFPFVNEMVVHVGATDDPQKIGFYSGFIESLFYVAGFCTSLYWGQLSDRVGRRPVLLIGLVGIIISATSFGMSETFTAMVISRSINGILNGNSPVIRSVVAEVTDKTNESIGFSLISLCWSIGAIIAPALGGLLARPADNFPSVFGNVQLFKRYPYLLPCLFGASFSVMGLVTGVFWLKETLNAGSSTDSKHPSRVPSETHTREGSDVDSTPTEPLIEIENASPVSAWELLKMKNVWDALVASWVFAFISIALEAVWLLWLYTPIQAGGIGLTTFDLGITFSCVGVFNTIVLLFIFPPLQRRFGSRLLHIVAMWAHVAQVALFPVVRAIAVWESGSRIASGPLHGNPGPWTIVAIGAMVIAKGISDLAFATISLLVNATAPNKATLGAINGLMSMISSLFRALGPVASTTMFAASISQNLLGGNLFWIVLLAVGFLAVYSAVILEDAPTVHDLASAEESEEEDEPGV